MGGTAAPLRHLPPYALPMSALSADELADAHATREPTEQAWSSPFRLPWLSLEESWRAKSAALLLRLLILGLAMPADVSVRARSRSERTPVERRRHYRQRGNRTFSDHRAACRYVGRGALQRLYGEEGNPDEEYRSDLYRLGLDRRPAPRRHHHRPQPRRHQGVPQPAERPCQVNPIPRARLGRAYCA